MEEEDWRRKKSGALIALHFRLLPNGTRTNNESEFRTSDEREREGGRGRQRGPLCIYPTNVAASALTVTIFHSS